MTWYTRKWVNKTLSVAFREWFEWVLSPQCLRRKLKTNTMDMKPYCCDMRYECDHELPLPPLPKTITNRPSTITGSSHETTTITDFDGLSEKYWGEILERSFSSNSLQASVQYHQQQQQRNNRMMMLHNSSRHHLNDKNTKFSDINLNRDETNLYYSNSEPHLVCEYDLQHDINCAKNKPFFIGTVHRDDGDI